MANCQIEHLSEIYNKFYAIGFASFLDDEFGIIALNGNYYECKIDSASIHFPDMLDSQGNKIFASLSEDGKGGDIMRDDEYYGIAKYKDSRFVVEYENVEECLYEGNFEVIGIQQ